MKSKFLYVVAVSLIAGPLAQAQTVVLSEGFEGVFPGSWTVGDQNAEGNPAYWGDVPSDFGTISPRSGNWMGYCAGVGFVGPSFAPSYESEMIAIMQRTVNLAGASNATLTFWFNIPSIEPSDFCSVRVNGAQMWSYASETFGWQQATIDLSAYVGGTAGITFRFSSDDFLEYEGWYLDDILVTASGGGGTQQPNLTPFQPTGWSDKIVVSTVTDTRTDDSNFTPSDTLYVDWAVINNGAAPVNSSFTVALYLDDVLRASWSVAPPVDVNNGVAVSDYNLGTLAAGTHTLRIRADSGGTVAESNEADNEYTKTITITARPTLLGSRVGNSFVLSWPTNAAGFTLQSVGTLSGATWGTVSPTPVIVGDRYYVTNAITGAARFYRLRK